jgi:protein-S-isoprenylcysteine O-methyltransferase Ste14
MQRYFGAATLVLLIGMVVGRSLIMRRQGIQAMHFGEIDKKDFLIPPFALFYFYVVFAAAFHWPGVNTQPFFAPEIAGWIGVGVCAAGLLLLLASLVSFGKSFRVGIDTKRPDELIRTGVFAFSRNPIYVAFALVLLGEFLIFPEPIRLIYLVAAACLMHRQVLREEKYLKVHYGQAYTDYSHRVRRYL